MKQTYTYEITDWKQWDKQLDLSTDRFHTKYGHYPNILVASPLTHQKIDIEANKKKQNLLPADKATAVAAQKNPPVWIEVAEVALQHCLLELAVDDQVPTDKYILVHDTEAEFDPA